MAVGLNAPTSTNPFDEPEDTEERVNCSTSSPTPSFTVLPFIKIPILIVCTVLVFGLLIAGTATTVLSFPPSSSDRRDNPPLDGDYKILGPLLLTSGCFLLCVNVALCGIITREAYYASRVVQPVGRAWNIPRPAPVAFVGGPFYIATSDPTNVSVNPPITTLQFVPPWWGQPNAPHPEINKMEGCENVGNTYESRTPQPPYNPDVVESVVGA